MRHSRIFGIVLGLYASAVLADPPAGSITITNGSVGVVEGGNLGFIEIAPLDLSNIGNLVTIESVAVIGDFSDINGVQNSSVSPPSFTLQPYRLDPSSALVTVEGDGLLLPAERLETK